jgi:hypothetical protein
VVARLGCYGRSLAKLRRFEHFYFNTCSCGSPGRWQRMMKWHPLPIWLAGVLHIGFGTYFEVFMLAGLLCIAAALMFLFIGTGRRGAAEPVTAKAYS